MENDIRRAINRAEGSAKLNPKVDTSGLNAQASKAGRAFGERFSSGAKDAMKALSVAVVGAGLVDQFRKVMSVGMDWTNNMNTLQAVTGATADQLKAAGAAARALGNDISLPATSANDAAAAMTELAKGGFTVQQAMDAAKGSLQLAAAAQISATDAATIQSNALLSFGLNANQAGKMADTLANAANASSAEIGDVAQALAQAGTVAHSFGLSAEDTSAAIALLAKNGIKGSDAGTLLKTSLQALTDQGNPAQGAIQELGLTVYDAQGKFVGLHTLFQQLGEAQGRMSDQSYQAATSVLFGSDAMRIAAIAGQDGSRGYDQMRTAIDRQGAAADVAAAKTKGLPGAWERVKNAIESLQLTAFDKLEGPVTKLLDGLSSGLGQAVPKIQEAWGKLSANPQIRSTFTDTVNVFKGLADAAKTVWPSLVQIGKSLAAASGALGVGTWKLFVTALQAAAGVVNTLAGPLQALAGFMKNQPGLVTAAVGAWLLFRTVPALMGRITTAIAPVGTAVQTMGQRFAAARGGISNFGSAYQTYMGYVRQANPGISTAANHLRTLGGVASYAASGGLNAVKGAASGLLGALGGPFSAALIGATIAFGLISAKNQQAGQSLKAYQDAVRNTEQAQVSLNEALFNSRGAFDDTVKASAADRIRAISEELKTASERTGSFLDQFRAPGQSLFSFKSAGSGLVTGAAKSQDQQIEDEANAAKSARKAIDDLKLSQQSLSDVAYGSQGAFDAMVSKLEAAGEGGHKAADQFRAARVEFLKQQDIAKTVTPGIDQLAKAMRTLADNTASAADKSTALKSALDALNPSRTAGDAEAAHTQAAAAAQQIATPDSPLDPTKGLGDQLFKTDGTVQTLNSNGVTLNSTLKTLVDTTADVATKGGDMAATLKSNQDTFAALAKQFQTDVPHIQAAFDALGGKDIQFIMSLAGAPDVTQSLGLVKRAFDEVPGSKDVTIKTSEIAGAEKQLGDLGFHLQNLPNGITRVTADTDAALIKIQNLIAAAAANPLVLTVDAKPVGFGAGVGVPRALGAIVAMAGGGLRSMVKPQTADIYAGRGAGTIFAEQETGGEAYIPLAAQKRSRSRRILAEVARLFGMNVMEGGGISVDSLKEFASQISGGGYVRGGGDGSALDGTDCSGAQAAIANFITGGSGRFSTGGEAAALLSRGFQQGDPPPGVAAYWVGWRQGGPGGGHTAGTIVDPLGGNVNVEMGGSSGGGAFGAGAGGASGFPNRAWIQIAGGEDPNAPNSFGGGSAAVQSARASVTSAKGPVTSAQASLDQANAAVADAKTKGQSADKVAIAEKKRDAAQQKLDAAKQRQTAAETKLADATDKAASNTGKNGGMDGQSLGQSIFSGILQSIGLDGSVFSNPFDWPNVKSAMAFANFGGGLLKGAMGGDPSGGMNIGGLNLPNITDGFQPMGPQALTPNAPVGADQGGVGGHPLVAYNGPVHMGVDPRAMTQRQGADMNQAWRRSGLPAIRGTG
jgi:TP901 family phage tail tape measure protein